MEKRALGRGLDALIPPREVVFVDTQKHEKVIDLAVANVKTNKYQPRMDFNEDKLNELIKTNSISRLYLEIGTEVAFSKLSVEITTHADENGGIIDIDAFCESRKNLVSNSKVSEELSDDEA